MLHLYSSYIHICFCYATPNEDQIHYIRLSLCTAKHDFPQLPIFHICKKYLYYPSQSVSGQPSLVGRLLTASICFSYLRLSSIYPYPPNLYFDSQIKLKTIALFSITEVRIMSIPIRIYIEDLYGT